MPRARPVPALLVRGHEIPLKLGETLIGRGTSCHVSIVGALVSRRHAKLENSGDRVTLTDLGSRNGVFVNGLRIEGSVTLEDGDSLLIGTTEFTFFLGAPDDHEPVSTRQCFDEQGNLVSQADEDILGLTTEVQFDRAPIRQFDREDITAEGVRPPAPRVSSSTMNRRVLGTSRSVDVASGSEAPELELDLPTPPSGALRREPARDSATQKLGSTPASEPLAAALDVVVRMLTRGDIDAAARALATHVARRIETIKGGHPVDPSTLQATGECCLALAAETGDFAWVDAAIDLHSASRKPMSADVVRLLEPLLSSLSPATRARLGAYQSLIRSLLGEVDVEELDACERILALGFDA